MRDILRAMRRHYSSHIVLWQFLLFIVIAAISAYIFYLRFPNNALYPNFFAEDGQHFANNIRDHGFIQAFLTPFNGYFIFGIYLLTAVGFVVNSIGFGGEFVNLPVSFAVVSYAFLGFCAALPILLLRNYLRLGYLVGLATLITLLPFPSFDYGTFGTIGNLKFAFGFIALLLLLYRLTLPKQSLRIIPIDLTLALCAFTTAGVYLILPFIILSDGIQLYKMSVLRNIKTVFTKQNISLWSGLVLVFLCIIQVLFVAINGLPDLPGYLDEPYEFAKTVEVFIARPYLYPFVSAAYHHLNDAIVVGLFLVSLIVIFTLGVRRHWWLYSMIILSIFFMTLVFVANRTGTAHYYNDYATSGFDNFFYPQNFMSVTLAVIVLSDITSRFKSKWRYILPIIMFTLLTTCSIRANSVYAPNDFMQYKIGTIYQQAKAACDDKRNDPITFSVYPFEFLTMTESRKNICTPSVYKERVSFDNFNLYNINNTAIDIQQQNQKFTQTFSASSSNLNGIAVYLGTYGNSFLVGYRLVLMDKDCSKTIDSVELPSHVRDNSIRNIMFDEVKESKNTTYCFSIEPTIDNPQQLAVWTTKQDKYTAGSLRIHGTMEPRDIVFFPLYK